MNRSPLLAALFHPVNLLMFAAAVLAGLLAAWWLAPVGLVFWLVMVIVIASDPGLKMTFTRQNRQPLAQRFQARFDRMERARFSIFNTLTGFSPQTRKASETVATALDDLVEHVYQLSLRMSSLDNNAAIQRLTSSSADDIAKMQKNIAEATDAAARQEYQSTLQSLLDSQTRAKAIDALLTRFDAVLTGTGNAVDSVVTGVVGLQGRSLPQVQEKVSGLLAALQTEETELMQFETDLDQSSVV
jgi:hypothetical protein